jgi:signal transduction histidine kinase
MRVPEILRTPTFRLVGIFSGAFILGILILFLFVYLQSAYFETRAIDSFVEREIAALSKTDTDELIRDVADTTLANENGIAYAAMFARGGERQSGNISSLPPGLPLDGHAHEVRITAADTLNSSTVRAAATRLPDGRVIVIARDIEELHELERIVRRALLLGAIPAVGFALCAGIAMSWREVRRVRLMHEAAAHILQGKLGERLPVNRSADDVDRLAMAVNRMLDEIERLLDEVRGVGDSIAHDLRTPLTYVRARLERTRDAAPSVAELENSIDVAVAGLDQTLGIITALLRITEIEEGNRRAAFADIDLARMARDVAELYGPIAENARIELVVTAPEPRIVRGDRDLLIEAIANVLDNAIKFAPLDSRIDLAVVDGAEGPIVRVRDRGPGIPPEELQSVLKRFYRGDKSRHLPGSGLGLGVVSAVMTLHRFRVAIDDAHPGCRFDLICAPHPGD